MPLSKTAIDKAEAADKDFVLWCDRLSGFGCRVWPSGKKVFIVQYRAGGRGAPTRKQTIGQYGVVTLDKARKAAEKILASVQLGKDPVAERRLAQSSPTLSDLCDEYALHGVAHKKPSTIKSDVSRIDAHIKPLLGRRKVSELTRRDVERFLRDVADGKTARDLPTKKRGRSIVTGGKGAATRTVRLLGGILTYAVAQGYIDTNPATGVTLFADRKMERYLSADELRRLFDALEIAETRGLPWSLRADAISKHRPKNAHEIEEKISPHATAAIRLLILTGCRLREILHLQWSDIDWQHNWLVLSDSKTGRRIVPLSSEAMEVLRGLARGGQYVIRGSATDKPRSDLKRPWERISAHAGISDVRLHDLRHTFASLGASKGISLQIIGSLLGHRSQETTARYAHLSDAVLRQALEQIAETAKAH